MSLNNYFLTAGEPVARFTKTVNHGITGWRLNPDDDWKKIEFSLITANADADYEDAVLEIYTEKELKFFQQANRYLFKAGLLRPYEGAASPVDTSNILTEDEIMDIASTHNIPQLLKRLDAISSIVTMRRIVDVAKEIGRPARTLQLLEERLAKLK